MRYLAFIACAACARPGAAPDAATTDSEVDTIAPDAGPIEHVFDYATAGPDRLSIMFTMAWFGIGSGDPQAPHGADPGFLNWQAGGTPCAGITTNATTVDSCIRYGANNACLATGAPQRKISSRRRPLTGIWSGTGRDTESERKLDLMLAMLRRPGCRADDGAKLDAWAVQLSNVAFTSKYITTAKPSADFPYRMLLALYRRADAAGITNAVLPGFDSTWYFHFGDTVGLGACDDSPGNPRQRCLDALRDDMRDLAVEARPHASAVLANGKPVLFVYTDHWNAEDQGHGGHQPTTAEWSAIFAAARVAANTDFYVVGVSNSSESFAAFDALAPWLNPSSYANGANTSVYTDALAHTRARHADLVDHVANYPGRLVYGGVTPGFDDFTRNWGGPCKERQMPPDAPRDPALMTAQSDYFATNSYRFRGFIGETWDDWTEGSEFEPDVDGGADRLVRLRQLIGRNFGDAADADGDARLVQRWQSYGQARNGTSGPAGTSPVTNLACD